MACFVDSLTRENGLCCLFPGPPLDNRGYIRISAFDRPCESGMANDGIAEPVELLADTIGDSALVLRFTDMARVKSVFHGFSFLADFLLLCGFFRVQFWL